MRKYGSLEDYDDLSPLYLRVGALSQAGQRQLMFHRKSIEQRVFGFERQLQRRTFRFVNGVPLHGTMGAGRMAGGKALWLKACIQRSAQGTRAARFVDGWLLQRRASVWKDRRLNDMHRT